MADRQTILITGAAGTLGKAFTRILQADHNVIGIDSNEWAVAEFQHEFPSVPIMLKDFDKWRFNQCPADTIIHCAAYKHVDLGEKNPHTFIENNVEKTGRLFAEAFKYDVNILFVSTDKSVEPISTYGFTKALGEKLAWHYEGSVARLGNILNSSGSVIPAWEAAIANKEPIKITDERMVRYCIEDVDAVTQIWQGFLKDKRLIIPEMGESVRLLDLLSDVLNRHGYKQVADYTPGVEVIGIRSGEKLEEKLKWDHE